MTTQLPPSDISPAPADVPEKVNYKILGSISFSHFLNDATQSLLLPIYPLIKGNFDLSFRQIGFITFTYQLTASFLQPLVGRYTDRKPQPYSLPVGMILTLSGLLLIAAAASYPVLLLGAALLGTGSSVFHPESSRVARMASGGRFGLAQSMFQVGGNAGSSCGPLAAAAVIIPLGQWSLSLFAFLPLTGVVLLLVISRWVLNHSKNRTIKRSSAPPHSPLPRKLVIRSLIVLLSLVFSKSFYMASITNYFSFYLIHKFGASNQSAQIHLFLFLFAVAAGTFLGGPIGDRIGRKYVIWFSILGIAPFTLVLPYVDLFWTTILIFLIGFILSSAFSAIVVFAQELLPGRTGTVAGLFFGLSFGLGGIGAAVFGEVADIYGIELVYQLCAFLPLLGLSAVFLPDLKHR